ncbi:PREDICTED: olfactory receptor 6M1-like [Thamnophis sirtalis]|uniref:Olfactory receptor 6M1-like n=1 Tax=Thamnophis sirtalis TaxID=35019 RepID=A0A6I9YBX0_9SAUR|nr:PREDICTED: olfactory receptor 6M1-like [Thamnophis sirtalis]
MEVQNVTIVREIFLLGFIFEPNLEIILFMVFLLIYLATVLGNTLIIALICIDHRLQTPMYFFLSNLSAIEIFMTTSVLPKMLANLLSERKTISFAGCFTQSYFYFFMGSTEFILFAAMSFDRYMAICYPLRYSILVTGKVCVNIVIGSWIGGFFSVFLSTVLKARLTYCRHVINHFFCDSVPLLHLACQDITMIELVDFLVSLILLLGSLSFTATSYIYIISTIVKIPSAEGRKKAFCTCASHFTVVSMGYGISIFVYVRPSQSDSMSLNKALAIFSGILTPFLNPFIFSLRNEQMKEVLRDVLKNMSFKIKSICSS